MKNKLTRTLIVASLTLAFTCTPDQARAEQPRMDKAIELLQEAKTAKDPVAVLEKAKTHVENATKGKGGRRVTAINKIDKAIAAKKKGKDVGALIDAAIADLQEGKEIQKDKKP